MKYFIIEKYIRDKNTEKDSVTFGWLKTDNYTIFYFMKKINYEGGNDLTKLIQYRINLEYKLKSKDTYEIEIC